MENFGNIKANQQFGTLTIKTSNGNVKFGIDSPGDKVINISEYATTETQPEPEIQFTEEQQAVLNSGITQERLETIENGIQELGEQNQEVLQKTNRIEYRFSGLGNEMQSIESNVESVSQDISDIRGDIEQAEARLTNVERRCDINENLDVDDLLSQIETLKQQVQALQSGKQDTLVSGYNLKSINYQSLLGEGNLDVQGGGSLGEEQQISIDQVTEIVSARVTREQGQRIANDEVLSRRIDDIQGKTNLLGNLSHYNVSVMTQEEYDALESKSNSTFYFIVD